MRAHNISVAEVRGSPRRGARSASLPPPSPRVLSSIPEMDESYRSDRHLLMPKPPPISHVLCDVCCEHVNPNVLRGCAACSHRYCAPCVDKYWTGAIYSGNHARLLCMYGGCGVFATDRDIAAVVSERTFRKMLYFRSRDRFDGCRDATWCAKDMCWEFLGRYNMNAMSDTVVTCSRCSSKTCIKCERLVVTTDSGRASRHICASRKPNKTHSALFSLWATVHTKACPACAARIQRNHGCSHMTCTRCSSYFCWRCKGFLNNGCPLPGRACICDRVMTAAAYSGLAVATVIGSPVIITAALIGGGPYVAYRFIRARRQRARTRRLSPADALSGSVVGSGSVHQHRVDLGGSSVTIGSTGRATRLGRAPGRVLQPDEMVVPDEDDFDSGSTRLTAFSEVMVTEARGLTTRPARRLRVQLQPPLVEGGEGENDEALSKVPTEVQVQVDRTMLVISQEENDLFGSSGHLSAPASASEARGVVDGGEDSASMPAVSVEACKVARPFVLERRRGSVSGKRVVRRAVL